LSNPEPTVKLQAIIRKDTDVGAVGSEDYAKVGDGARAKSNLARDVERTARHDKDQIGKEP